MSIALRNLCGEKNMNNGSAQQSPDIPALRQASMVSTARDFGPSVATILVNEGK